MAVDIPTPRSYSSILGEMIDAFTSRYSLRKIKKGGSIISILEAGAQSDVRSTQDIFTLLNSRSLNRSKGLALQRTAADENIKIRPATAASGKVTFTDSSFTKINTRIYPGAAAPNAGTLTIKVSNATDFLASGSIYIGRGTVNYEGPIALDPSSPPDDSSGSYWVLTLLTATQKFHDVNESVVLAQGGTRSISAGTSVQTPQSAVSSPVSYSTLFSAVIEDGEASVENVSVVCQSPGTTGNVPAGAISVLSSAPFPGATVANPLPFGNGLPADGDESLRERIRNARQTRTKGTRLSIINGAKGVTASDENKTVLSASLVAPKGETATLFIDDGTGYEERTAGVALETFVDQAIGGEPYFRVASAVPVSKAFATTTLTTPFALVNGAKLAVKVAGILSEHTFSGSEFRSIGNATPYEIVAAINGNITLGFGARTADSGTRVTLFARGDINEDIEVLTPDTGINANTFLGFPRGLNLSLRLYKNDRLLYKDGLSAILTSSPQSVWSNTIAAGVTLEIAVDNTPAAVYTFQDIDFATAGTGYTAVAATNSIAAWAAVFNAKVPGITASEAGGRLILTSNVGASGRASIVLSEPSGDPNNLIQKGIFSAGYGLSVAGASNDFTLDRNSGEGKLTIPLAAGDKLTAGTPSTRAYLQGGLLSSATVDIATGGATLWLAVDGDSEILTTGVSGSTSFDIDSTIGDGIARYTADSAVFGTGSVAYIQPGDWVIIWDSAFDVRGFWRISAVAGDFTWFEVERPQGPITDDASLAGDQLAVSLTSGAIAFVRSSAVIQEIRLVAGTNRTLVSVVDEINDLLLGATASVYRNTHIRITTNTFEADGDVMLAAADTEGQNLLITAGVLSENSASHLAAIIAGNQEIGTPNFEVGTVTDVYDAGSFEETGATFGTGDLAYWIRRDGTDGDNGFGKNVDRYDTIKTITAGVIAPRRDVDVIAIDSLVRNGAGIVTAITLVAHGLRVGDFFYLAPVASADADFDAGEKLVATVTGLSFTYEEAGVATTSTEDYTLSLDQGVLVDDLVLPVSPMSISPDDSLSVVIDGSASSKSFSIPFGRTIKSTSTYASSGLEVIDVDNSDEPLSVAFGQDDTDLFRDFAVFMHARGKSHGIIGSVSDYSANKAILWRYTRLGSEGNRARVAYVNPTAPSQEMELLTTNGAYADLQISLPSGAANDALSLTNSTRFTVSVAGEYTTFTYSKPTIAIGNATRTGSVRVDATTSTPHGFIAGETVLITSPLTNLHHVSGKFTVLPSPAPTPTTFSYIDGLSDGTSTMVAAISVTSAMFDPDFVAGGLLADDIVTINTASGFDSDNVGTFRVTSVSTSAFIVRRTSGSGLTETTPVRIGSTDNMLFYRIDATTTSQDVADWVNDNISDTITATVIDNVSGGGDPGTGIINKATADEYLDADSNATGGTTSTWTLADGINYVLSSDLVAEPNTITLKNAVTADLTAEADFANEEMKLAPITAPAIVRYIGSPAVSGLYASSEIVVADQDHSLQLSSTTMGSKGLIQVTGGTANTTAASISGTGTTVDSTYSRITIARSQAQGFVGGGWVSVQAENIMPKSTVWDDTSTIAITAAGVVTFDVATRVLRQSIDDVDNIWKIDRVGNFVAYTQAAPSGGTTLSGSIIEGDWVNIILAGADAVNTGVKQVVRKTADNRTFWVENPDGLSESVAQVVDDSLDFFSYDSVMPGDIFVIDTDAYGLSNHGSFTVLEHGAATTQFTINGAPLAASGTLGAEASFVRVMEKDPARLIKRIHTIGQNNTSADYLDVVFTTSTLASKMSATALSTMLALDKLAFDTSIVGGADAYSYSTGLIGEVTKVLYGDASNPDIYPGIVAFGANINSSGPIVKRIAVSLAIRINKGGVPADIVNRVKSAVASTINAVPLGVSVDISSYLASARAVGGVGAVTPISPALTNGNDLIAVQANEKPRVLDIDQDINVSIIGS